MSTLQDPGWNHIPPSDDIPFDHEIFTGEMEKAPRDHRLYRLVQCFGGMEVLLASDPNAKRGAAVLDINAGFLDEPEDLLGLAHLVEHCIASEFSEKSEMPKIFYARNGKHDAYTQLRHTVYSIQVDGDVFEQVLRLFAQGILNPTFATTTVETETSTVDSEFRGYFCSDHRRVRHLQMYLSRSGSRIRHNFEGNALSLHSHHRDVDPQLQNRSAPRVLDDLRDHLRAWHSLNYTHNNMKLVIVAPGSLDDLTRLVLDVFQPLPGVILQSRSTDTPNDSDFISPWTDDQENSIVFARSLDTASLLDIRWAIPAEIILQRISDQPTEVLCRIVKSKHPESLYHCLRSHDWVRSLDATIVEGDLIDGFQYFAITCDLTTLGWQNWLAVSDIVHDYVSLLTTNILGVSGRDAIEGYEAINKLFFMNLHYTDSLNWAALLSSKLRERIPRTNLFTSIHPIDDRTAEGVAFILGYLTRLRARTMLFGSNWEGMVAAESNEPLQNWQRAPFYNTEFIVTRAPTRAVQLAGKASVLKFRLPTKNPFVPTDFTIINRNIKVPPFPVLFTDLPRFKIWVKKDDKHGQPHAYVFLELRGDAQSRGWASQDTQISKVFCAAVARYLSDNLHEADEARMWYRFSRVNSDFRIEINGYNQTLPLLLRHIITMICGLRLTESDFKNLLDERRQELDRNRHSWQAKDISTDAFYAALQRVLPSYEDHEEELRLLQPEHIETFWSGATENLSIRMLVYGNVDDNMVLSMKDIVQEQLDTSQNLGAHSSKQRWSQLPPGRNLTLHLSDATVCKDQAVTYGCYVCDATDMQLRAAFLLYRQVMTKTFNDLFATAYHTDLSYVILDSNIWLCMTVQDSTTCRAMEGAFDNIWPRVHQVLRNMTVGEFREHVQQLGEAIQMVPDTWYDEMLALRSGMDDAVVISELETSLAHTVFSLTQDDVLALAETRLDPSSPTCRKLSVWVDGGGTCDAEQSDVDKGAHIIIKDTGSLRRILAENEI